MAKVKICSIYSLLSLIYCLNNCVTAQHFSSNVASCSSTCLSTFQDHEGAVCIRGCRLMSLLAFIHGPMMSMEELGQACLKTCSEAYVTTNASACAFGCQSQLPTVEEQRNNIMQLSMNLERDPMFEMTRRFMEYSNRIMNSLMNGLNDHVARVGWISVSSYTSDDGGKVVVVVDGPKQIQLQPRAEILGGSEVELEDREVRHLSETKQPVPALAKDVTSCLDNVASYLFGKNRPPMVSFLFLLFVAVVALATTCCICYCCFSAYDRHVEKNQKLSIYGDLEYLPMYDEGLPTFMKHKNIGCEAPPLPLKTQKI